MTNNTVTESTPETTVSEPASRATGPKLVELSPRATKWCKRVAGIALRKAFKTKSNADLLQEAEKRGGVDGLTFFVLPKVFQKRRTSHTDSAGKVFIHPKFLDQKNNLRRKLPKTERDELKAAVYKEVVRQFLTRSNEDFYKVMTRCPWEGPSVDGAKGSSTAARTVLEQRRKQRAARQRVVIEVPTGLKEDVKMWSLSAGQHVLVKDADIFIANGSIKIARGVDPSNPQRKLRTMLPGGAALKAKLGL